MNNLRLLIPVFVFAIFVIGLSSCRENGPRDIRDYYFPLRELEEGLVYEYQPVHLDSLTPAYWYYRSFIQDDGVFLTGTYYEYDLVPLQLVREELVRNGMLVQDVNLYDEVTDSAGLQDRTAAEVLQGSAFPFEVTDSSGVFLYKIRWEPPQDSGAVITLVKNRQYLGDTVVQVMGEARDAIVLSVRELLSYDKEGVFEQEYGGREIYAKGIGLVYYDKKIGGSMMLSYALKRRYPMNELEQQYEQRIRKAQ